MDYIQTIFPYSPLLRTSKRRGAPCLGSPVCRSNALRIWSVKFHNVLQEHGKNMLLLLILLLTCMYTDVMRTFGFSVRVAAKLRFVISLPGSSG